MRGNATGPTQGSCAKGWISSYDKCPKVGSPRIRVGEGSGRQSTLWLGGALPLRGACCGAASLAGRRRSFGRRIGLAGTLDPGRGLSACHPPWPARLRPVLTSRFPPCNSALARSRCIWPTRTSPTSWFSPLPARIPPGPPCRGRSVPFSLSQAPSRPLGALCAPSPPRLQPRPLLIGLSAPQEVPTGPEPAPASAAVVSPFYFGAPHNPDGAHWIFRLELDVTPGTAAGQAAGRLHAHGTRLWPTQVSADALYFGSSGAAPSSTAPFSPRQARTTPTRLSRTM